MMLRPHHAAGLGLLAALAAPAAQAAVTVYDSESAFLSASPALSAHDFSGIVVPSPPDLVLGAQTIGGVTFDSHVIPFTLPAAGTSWHYGVNFYSGQSNTLAPSDVQVNLAGAYAIGFEYGAYGTTPGTPVTIELSTGDTYTRTLPAQPGLDTLFIGFVSTTPITSVSFATIANVVSGPPIAYSMDVLRFSVSALVPEPGAAWLLLPGLAVLALARRRGSALPA